MTRTLAASVNSYLSTPDLTRFTLADIELVGGTVRAFNGVGYLMVGANTYAGLGTFGGVEPVREDATEFPRNTKLWLSAVNSQVLSEGLSEQLFNRRVTLYRCWFDRAAQTIVNTAEMWYRGYISEVDLFRGDEQRGDYFEVTVDTLMRSERKASYYTTEDLAITASGDTFFTHLPKIPLFKTLWGQQAVFFGVGGGGSWSPEREFIHPRARGGR